MVHLFHVFVNEPKNVSSKLITCANDTKLRWGTIGMKREKECKGSKLKIWAEREKWDQYKQTTTLCKISGCCTKGIWEAWVRKGDAEGMKREVEQSSHLQCEWNSTGVEEGTKASNSDVAMSTKHQFTKYYYFRLWNIWAAAAAK